MGASTRPEDKQPFGVTNMKPEQNKALGAELCALAERITNLCPTYNAAAERHCALQGETAEYNRFYVELRHKTYWEPAGTPARDLLNRVEKRYSELCDARDKDKALATATYTEISSCWRRAEEICAEILGGEPCMSYLDSTRGLECIASGRRRCIASEEIDTGHLLTIANYLNR